MRLIDADSLKPDMIHEYNTFPAAPQYGTLQRILGVSMEQIAKAPTIDLVRCGECKHYISDGGAIMFCENTDLPTNKGDYCSWGERRE